MHHILFYEYVPEILERRGPHRAGHLGRIREAKDEGRIVMAGALGDPVHGGVFVFRETPVGDIEAWSDGDPYVEAGLVAERRIEVWNVV